jgi:hypothetical protein
MSNRSPNQEHPKHESNYPFPDTVHMATLGSSFNGQGSENHGK